MEKIDDSCIARGRDMPKEMRSVYRDIGNEEMQPIKNAVWNTTELATIKNSDRLLPSQPYFQKMYKGTKFYPDLERILFSMFVYNGDLDLSIKLKPGMTYAAMGSEINTLRFYQFLINICRYRHILELGTYIGVSTIYLAQAAMKNNGSVTTIEIGQEFFDIALGNIERNGFTPYVWQIRDDCLRFLQSAKGEYDFILIDAAKESYKELLELSMQRLTYGGLILVDDVFFQGDTLNDVPTSEKGAGVKKCLEFAASLDRWEKVILPIGNGLMLLRRK